METFKFQKLIESITGRDFKINTKDAELQPEKEYKIFRVLPIHKMTISFNWKTPKTNEKFLKSFITAFCNKYKEPNPEAYNRTYNGTVYKWEDKTDKEKEFCYYNHSSNMYNKKHLLNQVQANFNNENIEDVLCKYGFYATEYGIGIFALWETQQVLNAINKMNNYLKNKSIAFKNEYSDARWVLRFKLGLDKTIHTNILNNF